MQVVRLPDAAAVLAATGRDHYARNTIRPDLAPTVGWVLGAAVAWTGVDAEERVPYLSVLGPADEAADMADRAAEEWPDLPVTMPADLAALRPGLLAVEHRWQFRTASALPAPDGTGSVRLLPGCGDERIDRLLDHVGGPVSARPGDPAVRRWAVVEEDGEVLACAADTSGSPGVGHMGSVAVHPRARGRGLGSAVAGRLTRELLGGGCDVVAVGVFAEKTAARRLYDRLGYRTEHELVSGRLHRC